MVYQVISWLFPEGFPEASTKLVTTKRFSDFKKLHKALSHIHKVLYLSGTMPSLTKANFFHRYDEQVLGKWPMSSVHNVNKQLSFLKNVNKHLPYLYYKFRCRICLSANLSAFQNVRISVRYRKCPLWNFRERSELFLSII